MYLSNIHRLPYQEHKTTNKHVIADLSAEMPRHCRCAPLKFNLSHLKEILKADEMQ